MNDVNLLQSFLAVYRVGSITGASQQLNISQPAVTAHIRTLERQLGGTLFSPGARPTSVAKSLAMRVAPHLDALVNETRVTPTGHTRPVTVTGPADLLATLVVPALAPLIAEGMRVFMSADARPAALERVVSAEVDVAVTLGGVAHRGLRAVKLVDSELALVGAPRWAECLGGVTIERQGGAALGSVPVLAYSRDLELIEAYFGELFGSVPEMRPAFVFDDLRALVSAVRNGAGITVLPTCFVRDDLKGKRVLELHRPRRRPASPIVATVNPANPDSRLSIILDTLRSHTSLPNPGAVA